MVESTLFELVLDSLPKNARHRRSWLALVACFTRIERLLRRHFADEYNSSLPRYDVLTALALTPAGLTMGELATMLIVTKGNITGVVRRLEEEGLVRKTTLKTDRRIQSVTISAKGKRLWDGMHADYDRIIAEILSGSTTKDLHALTQMLEETRIAVEKKSDGD